MIYLRFLTKYIKAKRTAALLRPTFESVRLMYFQYRQPFKTQLGITGHPRYKTREGQVRELTLNNMPPIERDLFLNIEGRYLGAENSVVECAMVYPSIEKLNKLVNALTGRNYL